MFSYVFRRRTPTKKGGPKPWKSLHPLNFQSVPAGLFGVRRGSESVRVCPDLMYVGEKAISDVFSLLIIPIPFYLAIDQVCFRDLS